MSDHPVPVSQIDKQMASSLRGFHRLRWWSVAVGGVLLALAVIVLAIIVTSQQAVIDRQQAVINSQTGVISHQQAAITHQQEELAASCGFYRVLGILPVVAMPPVKRPSRVAVQIVAGARVAYTGQQCRPPLPPPDPSVVRWAAYYHLKLPG